MLTIHIPAIELFDEERDRFITVKDTDVKLEHSLLSVSLWESKHKKAFLDKSYEKTPEEILDYIRCMCVDDIDSDVIFGLTNENIDKIKKYIEDPMTATFFFEKPNETMGYSNKIVTNELIYYWMTAFEIPFTCETWHLNRLLTLIRVCNEKNKEANKKPGSTTMSRSQLADREALNQARKEALGIKD